MSAIERFCFTMTMALTAAASDLRVRAREEKGAAMVEYGLLVAFIAVIALVAVKALGTKVSTLFNSISFT